MRVLALDIGGANLKAAHADGTARSMPFEVWRRPEELGKATAELIARMPPFNAVAVTMTAELCDCFETKAEGVGAALDAVEFAVSRLARSVPVRVWTTDGRLVPAEEARAEPLPAAASNWLALATWAGRLCPSGPGLVIDVGSTTTDIIPLRDGVPVPRGRTDVERLSCGELVYSGVRRTPLFALVHTLDVAGLTCRVAAELFATTRDVYLWIGDLPEQPGDCETADGRPATREYASHRLARVVCADRTMLTEAEIDAIARQIADAQLADLLSARSQVEANLSAAPRTIILAGSGEFLARRLAHHADSQSARVISLAEQFGPNISSAACSYALAVLAAERWTGDTMSHGTTPSSRVPRPDHSPLTTHHSLPVVVIKVGGSLLDLPDLADRLQSFLATFGDARVLLVVGGGAAGELVRQRDRFDDLGDDQSHWLAVRAMSFNGFLVEALSPNSTVVSSLALCRSVWEADRVPILDPHTFLMNEEAAGRSRLPHTWSVTSDTIAAHVARLVDADELVLLKSVTWPDGDLAEAARRGVVDECLPHELEQAPRLRVRIENLRAFQAKVESGHE